MDELYIIGASGFGREVAWLIENTNDYQIKGFIDDNINIRNTSINGYPVIGDINHLKKIENKINVVIAIGNPIIRNQIVETLSHNPNINFPNIIANDVIIHKSIQLGSGNIICAGSILTTNITIGSFNHINLLNTIGHDCILDDFITIYPGCNISGNVRISSHSEIGTGTKIIQGMNITSETIIGAGSVVVKDIGLSGTYVGVPVKKIYHQERK